MSNAGINEFFVEKDLPGVVVVLPLATRRSSSLPPPPSSDPHPPCCSSLSLLSYTAHSSPRGLLSYYALPMLRPLRLLLRPDLLLRALIIWRCRAFACLLLVLVVAVLSRLLRERGGR